MGKLRNPIDAVRLISIVHRFEKNGKELDAARAAGDFELEKKLIPETTTPWAEMVAETFGMDIQFEGLENVPKKDGIVIISNHQGYADIVANILVMRNRPLGFIAKAEVEKVPYLGKWVHRSHAMYIERDNPKAALKSISEGAKSVKNGFNIGIFPEGTRSRGPFIGPFKPGAFKLATKAKAPILPVTIHGTYHVFEEKGYVQPAKIRVVVHPAVETADLDRHGIVEMEKDVENTIRTTFARLLEEEEKEKGGK